MTKRSAPHFFESEIVNGFKLVRLFKTGADGEVWGAVDFDGTRRVLKFKKADSGDAKRFVEMSKFLMRSDCSYLERVLAFFGENAEYHCTVCEYFDNGTLAKAVSLRRKFSVGNVVHVFEGILTALDFLGRNGVVHRDVKPSNVLFDSGGNPRLCDFSIAKIGCIPERTGLVFGTAQYMSPEQATDSSAVDLRCDLFSLSSLLFEVITGNPRFAEEGFTETLKKVLSNKNPIDVDVLAQYIPLDLAYLISSMSEHSPDTRPQSAAEILAALRRMNLPKNPVEF